MTKKKTVEQTKRSHHAPKPTTSTALVRRATVTRLERKIDQLAAKPAPEPAVPAPGLEPNVLGEDASTGAMGLVEIVLTAAEEAVCAEPVNEADILVKPDAQGTIYLPHPAYMKWYNRAFGRFGWRMVPKGKPLINNTVVVVPYMFYIHGKAVAFAYGEQEYHPNNKQQTYGDAVEATRASGLRRCAKQLAMGMELWDREFGRRFLAAHCVEVWVKDTEGKTKKQWRRKIDPPFWNEEGFAGQKRPDATRSAPRAEPPTMRHDPHAEEPITSEQVKRFWTIARKRGRHEPEIKLWLGMAYKIESTSQIKRKDYEAICRSLEHPGPLVMDTRIAERQPGEDG